MYVRAGKYDQAKAAFERILETRPRSGFAYLGIARVMARSRNSSAETIAQKQLADVWKNADKDLIKTRGSTN
jgi:hypothetical protein